MAFSLRLNDDFSAADKSNKRYAGPKGLVRAVRDHASNPFAPRPVDGSILAPPPETSSSSLRPIPGSSIAISRNFRSLKKRAFA